MEPQPLPADDQPAPTASDDLQFEHAEAPDPGASIASCTGCKRPVAGYYYQVNGQTICVPCREALAAALAAGSPIGRFLKAIMLGVLAAIVGAGIYYGVTVITGYELGLIAIVLGLLVGAAVRMGSGGRGGWFYQLVAIVMTYASVSGAYVPEEYSSFKESLLEERQAKAQQAAATAPAASPAQAGEPGELTGPDKAGLGVMAFITSLLWPLVDTSKMGYIIKGIALYEAWKINRKRRIDVEGPFAVGPQPAMTIPAGVPAS